MSITGGISWHVAETPLMGLSLASWQSQIKELEWGHVSNEKNLGWLGYIGDYTTQLYRDNQPL